MMKRSQRAKTHEFEDPPNRIHPVCHLQTQAAVTAVTFHNLYLFSFIYFCLQEFVCSLRSTLAIN